MSYKIRFVTAAEDDLVRIYSYLIEESGSLTVANTWISKLRESINSLNEFPNRGALPTNRILLNLGYRFLIHGDYLVFYKVFESEKVVRVMAILHGKQSYLRILKLR